MENECVLILRGECMCQDPVEGRGMQGRTEKMTVLLRSIAVAMAWHPQNLLHKGQRKPSSFLIFSSTLNVLRHSDLVTTLGMKKRFVIA